MFNETFKDSQEVRCNLLEKYLMNCTLLSHRVVHSMCTTWQDKDLLVVIRASSTSGVYMLECFTLSDGDVMLITLAKLSAKVCELSMYLLLF